MQDGDGWCIFGVVLVADVVMEAAAADDDATVATPETIHAFASIDENSGPSPSAKEPGDGLLVASIIVRQLRAAVVGGECASVS